MKRVIFSVFLMAFVCSKSVFAQPPENIYKEANLSYENKDYKNAVSLYESLIRMDKVSPEVFYNLGNSYFKLNQLGEAILNYERAKRLAPRDRDIILNLKLARTMTVDKIESAEKGFILSLFLFPYDKMNINELTLAVSIIYLIIIILFSISIFMASKRNSIFYVNIGLAVFLAIFSMYLFSKIYNERVVKEGIVVSKKVDVRSGPRKDYLLQFSLHEGTKVHILKQRQGWYEVGLSKDLRGWLPKDTVDII